MILLSSPQLQFGASCKKKDILGSHVVSSTVAMQCAHNICKLLWLNAPHCTHEIPTIESFARRYDEQLLYACAKHVPCRTETKNKQAQSAQMKLHQHKPPTMVHNRRQPVANYM